MNFAKARGAQVVGLTDGPMSPVYATSTVCLTARTDMASFVDSMAAPAVSDQRIDRRPRPPS